MILKLPGIRLSGQVYRSFAQLGYYGENSMPVNIKQKIEELKEIIRQHDHRYYILSEPVISDKEYDDLMRRLKGLEDKYPQYKSDDSPTARVSDGILKGFKTVKHRQKMISLDNTYSFTELREWDIRVHKGLRGNKLIEYLVELKIDGVSANLTFENGRLITGATRGDGETGEEITANLKTIRAIPLVLRGKDMPDLIEIRGEVYMDINYFRELNKEREDEASAVFANPRNAASGSLKLLDTAIVAKRRLSFFAHSLGEYQGVNILSQMDFLEKLKNWGMRVNPQYRLCKNIDQVIDYCQGLQEKRDRLDYEIDGIVVKVNDLKGQLALGYTLKSPRWAVAYKFPARQATTEILDIQLNVGRTGVITPTARLKPVECSGVIIQHATLHNFDEIKRLNVKIADRVLIERAGDVIPKVVKVVQSKGKKPFLIPKNCPVCNGRVIKEKEEAVAYRCINPICPAQLERGILHFSSRLAMDIQGLGEAAVKQLVKFKLVRNFSDIYNLKKEDLLRLELFKDKKAQNLLMGIEKSKKQPLSRLIYSLGIRHVGEKAAYILAVKFRDMDNLIKSKKEDLSAIYEIGEVMSASIRDYFSQPQIRKMIEELRNSGLNFKEEFKQIKNTPFTGKAVVFTGELKGLTRSQAEKIVREAGGNFSYSVSKNTDFVVAGDNPGHKYKQAKKVGVKIINEQDFSRLLKS
ncbi:MAG: NAD-dependent DNA ligase LigA [Candidatus Omnitrophota bacterium]